jgi:stringent starvation protein B
MPSILPPKKDVALALLDRASVFIHLDPRSDDVLVPSWLKKQPQLVLQVGRHMAVRIPDLEVVDEAVACTLSFNRSPHYCYVPWSAVYALVGEDGRGMVWPDDIPAEVSTASLAQGGPRLHAIPGGQSAESGEVPRPGAVQQSVAEGQKAAEGRAASPGSGAASDDSGRPLRSSERPYLRLVR